MVKTAPWQSVCELLLMATEPASVNVVDVEAATSRVGPSGP